MLALQLLFGCITTIVGSFRKQGSTSNTFCTEELLELRRVHSVRMLLTQAHTHHAENIDQRQIVHSSQDVLD